MSNLVIPKIEKWMCKLNVILSTFENCPKCGKSKHKLVACPFCGFLPSNFKQLKKVKRKTLGIGQKYTKEQLKAFKAKNNEIRRKAEKALSQEALRSRDKIKSAGPISRPDVKIGFDIKSNFTDKNQGKWGIPKDRTDYSADAVINRGWTREN